MCKAKDIHADRYTGDACKSSMNDPEDSNLQESCGARPSGTQQAQITSCGRVEHISRRDERLSKTRPQRSGIHRVETAHQSEALRREQAHRAIQVGQMRSSQGHITTSVEAPPVLTQSEHLSHRISRLERRRAYWVPGAPPPGCWPRC